MTSVSNSHPLLHRLRALIVKDDAADTELMVAEVRRNGFELSWKRVQTEEDYLSRLAESLEIVLAASPQREAT